MRRFIVLAAFAFAGCTTVSNGPMQRIRVDSNPQGAAVEVRHCGAMATKSVTTPGVAWVSRRSTQCELVFRNLYYEEQRVRLRRHTSRNMDAYGAGIDMVLDSSNNLGEVAVFGAALLLPSLAVDAASGSMFELQPNDLVVQLVPAPQDWRDRKAP